MFQPDDTKPIYRQLAEWLETEILNGHFRDGDKVYSQYQLADMYTINPATAAKGLSILADEGILYKKRGLGMFVVGGAEDVIRQKRRATKVRTLARTYVQEAKHVKMTEDEMLALIRQMQKEESGDED
ncbi:GntR family transcriptional regulator [Salisediminibacterium beveridgei]|uniref:Transcriptional regulator, GntR family n=1 Tax=Salisediminibacterium beveridgei TaxID=632773 RepID=A0A1D7QYW7_9BACI|nr:GntR family transcriptional regulator [Salisediminibacterium beveridgei]AOM84199.1 Transcriptional regulator, GntR family [Salisediminibacterium beveridgei]